MCPRSLYLATPLVFNSPGGGFSWDDLRNIFCGCQWVVKVPNAVEILPKISTVWVGCTSVTDRQTDRQTDERQQFTFAKNGRNTQCTYSVQRMVPRYNLLTSIVLWAVTLYWPVCVGCRSRWGRRRAVGGACADTDGGRTESSKNNKQ